MQMSEMADNDKVFTSAEIREQNLYTDAVIQSSSGREWPVHKVLICPLGSFFSNAFSRWYTETLELDVSDDIVQVIIDLAYSGRCGLDVENVLEVLSAAFMYQLESLIQKCVTFVLDNMIVAKHVLAVKGFARDHQVEMEACTDGALVQIVDKYIRRNFTDVIVSDDAYELFVEDLEAYVKEDDLNIDEEELLCFVLNYIKFHQLNNEKAGQLLANVRLGLVDSPKLAKIADENQMFRTELETRGEVIGPDHPRYPRDIVIVAGDGPKEIFNIRKNEWKRVEMNDISPDIVSGNILYDIEFLNDGLTKIKSFDIKNGRSMPAKWSQLPTESEIDVVDFLAWNGGILAIMNQNDDASRSAASYDTNANVWATFPDVPFAVPDVVDGFLFPIGGYNEEDDDLMDVMGNNIEYFDTETWSWKLCGYLKENPQSLRVKAVKGKVYAFSLDEKYAECFQPVWENGRMHLTWFPNLQLPVGNSNMSVSVLDNKILFAGGIQEDLEDMGRKQVHIFSPRSGEWSRAADLHGRKINDRAITINTSEFELERIKQL